jgi:EmrB/QacA subfamily drug resistance transporter
MKKQLNKKVIMWIISTSLFMEMMDSTIINTAIPEIAKSFQTNPVNLKFAITSYLLSLAVFIPISGWAADRYGTKTVFSTAISIFTIGSIFCGFSNSLIELSLFRALQGFGGAMMTPVARLILVRVFPPKELVKATMYVFLPALIGPVAGPLVGGAITTYTTWRWVFFINIPIGIIALILAIKYIQNEVAENKTKLDVLGFLLIGTSLSCFAVAMESVGESIISLQNLKIISAIAITTFLLFIIHAIHSKEKSILNLQLFKFRTYRIGVIGNTIAYISTGGVAFLLPLLFQLQFGMSPLKSGLLIAPMALGALTMRAISSKFIKIYGFKKVIFTAPFGIFSSLILIAFISQNSSYFYICSACALLGFFNILLMSSNGPMIYADIPKIQSANATSMDITIRQFSASLSVSLGSFLLLFFLEMLNTTVYSTNGINAFKYTFLIFAGIILLQIIVSFGLKKDDGLEASRGAN